MRFKPAVWLAVLAAAFMTATVSFAGAGDPVRSAGSTLVDSVADSIDALEGRIDAADSKIAALDARVKELEAAKPAPEPTPTPTPPPPPPPAGQAVEVVKHTITTSNPDGYGHLYSWTVSDSPNVETYPAGNTGGDKHATIRWEDGGKYAGTKTSHSRCAFKPIQGSPARLLNYHIQPADAPDGWNQRGVDGSYVTGVSPVAIDWKDGSVQGGQYNGLMLVLQPNERGSFTGSPYGNRIHWPILSDAEMRDLRSRGEYVELELQVTWGLANTSPKGAAKLWLYRDGVREATPRIDLTGVNTRWLNQGMVTFWQGGGYWSSGLSSSVVDESALCQHGPTREAMLADKPVFYSGWGTGTRVRNAGTFTYGG